MVMSELIMRHRILLVITVFMTTISGCGFSNINDAKAAKEELAEARERILKTIDADGDAYAVRLAKEVMERYAFCTDYCDLQASCMLDKPEMWPYRSLLVDYRDLCRKHAKTFAAAAAEKVKEDAKQAAKQDAANKEAKRQEELGSRQQALANDAAAIAEEKTRREKAAPLLAQTRKLEAGNDLEKALAKYYEALRICEDESVRKTIDILEKRIKAQHAKAEQEEATRKRNAEIASLKANYTPLIAAKNYIEAKVLYKHLQELAPNEPLLAQMKTDLRKQPFEEGEFFPAKVGGFPENGGGFLLPQESGLLRFDLHRAYESNCYLFRFDPDNREFERQAREQLHEHSDQGKILGVFSLGANAERRLYCEGDIFSPMVDQDKPCIDRPTHIVDSFFIHGGNGSLYQIVNNKAVEVSKDVSPAFRAFNNPSFEARLGTNERAKVFYSNHNSSAENQLTIVFLSISRLPACKAVVYMQDAAIATSGMRKYSSFAVTDCDGDGLDEILYITKDKRASIAKWNGRAFITLWTSVSLEIKTICGVCYVDLNGDGAPEVVVATGEGGEGFRVFTPKIGKLENSKISSSSPETPVQPGELPKNEASAKKFAPKPDRGIVPGETVWLDKLEAGTLLTVSIKSRKTVECEYVEKKSAEILSMKVGDKTFDCKLSDVLMIKSGNNVLYLRK